MKKSKPFPVGESILIVKEIGNPPKFDTLESHLLSQAIEISKDQVRLNGCKQSNQIVFYRIEEKKSVFCASMDTARKDMFFWAYSNLFTIHVVSSKEIIPKEIISEKKLFLVLDKVPYYFNALNDVVLTCDEITEKEKEYIKKFEKGIGLLYDSVLHPA